jgi:hypothetical protein
MSDDKYEYGQELKIIRFSVTDDDHARLLTKLRNYNLRVSQLFRAVIDGIIEEEDNVTNFLNEYALEHKLLSKGRYMKLERLKKKGKKKVEDFGFLDDAEKEDIFDLIAQEFPDL